MRFFVQFFLPAFGERDIASITSADIYRWFDALLTANKPGGGAYAPRTLHSIWGQLHTFFGWCSMRYAVPNPIAARMPRTPPAERNVSFWEVTQFRAFIDHVDDVTWRTFFTFQYYTGCRIGETLALQEKDYTGDVGDQSLAEGAGVPHSEQKLAVDERGAPHSGQAGAGTSAGFAGGASCSDKVSCTGGALCAGGAVCPACLNIAASFAA